MIQELRLENFKNFREAALALGPLTLLVGTNASGKSNLRDAFRILHGISRGYSVAGIFGENREEGWKGIRGGIRETAQYGEHSFALEATLTADDAELTYRIKVKLEMRSAGFPPRVVEESLWKGKHMVFDSRPEADSPDSRVPQYIVFRLPQNGKRMKGTKKLRFISDKPVLSQLLEYPGATSEVKKLGKRCLDAFRSMRFFELTPDAMRLPSIPGQTLGDRGENLSSVLQAICANEKSKNAVVEWINELTPLDVTEFEFVPDQTGKVLVSLIEANGQKTSAYSASDGTLRFLAVIAAVLGTQPAQFNFFEELENGIHPTRLYLLLQLIEQKVAEGNIQVVATSHSPQLLGFLSERARASASLVYRLSHQPDARIRRILDIPEAARVLREQDLARLHSSGWLEDAVAFLETEEVGA